MALSSEFLQELKFKTDIVDIISRYVNLSKRGSNYVGLCPFHSEKTASFTVYPKTQSFYCFGCGAGGDGVNFIRGIEHLDWNEAVKYIAQLYNIPLPEEKAEDDEISKRKKRLLEINKAAAKYFNKCFYESEKAKNYLSQRQMKSETVTKFGIGYAPDSWDSLIKHLYSLGYNKTDLIGSGLVSKSSKTGNHFDSFRNRIIFPIIDLRGNVIAFGGRLLDGEGPKYLNSPDTIVFKKTYNLFNLNNAKNQKEDYLILCEGYMDVISISQHGFQNAVATLGTAITQEQARIMSRYTKKVVIAYDSDEAGQKAAKKAIEYLTSVGLEVSVLKMTGAKDPDEFIKKFGKERFSLLLKGSDNYISYQILRLKEKFDIDSVEDKISFTKEAVKILGDIENKIEQDIHITKFCNEYNVEKDAFIYEIEKYISSKKKKIKNNIIREQMQKSQGISDRINPEKSQNLREARAEEMIIGAIVSKPEIAKFVFDKINSDFYKTSYNKKIISVIEEFYNNDQSVDIISLGKKFNTGEIAKITEYCVVGANLSEKEVKDCIETLISSHNKIDSKNTEEDISNIINEIKKNKTRGKK